MPISSDAPASSAPASSAPASGPNAGVPASSAPNAADATGAAEPRQTPARDRVTLIVPTMNEVEGMQAIMPLIDPAWYDELLIVDGGSTDGTFEWCEAQGYRVVRQSGRGLPNAMNDGLELAENGILVTFSPDGNSIPELIPELVKKLIEDDCDMVIASRYLGDAYSEDDDALTAIGNSMFTWIINFLFRGSYTDSLVMYRAYRAEAVRAMLLAHQGEENWFRRTYPRVNSWEIGACTRACLLGLKVGEIEGVEPKRLWGERKMSIVRNGLGAVGQILSDRFFGRRVLRQGGSGERLRRRWPFA